MLFIFVTWFPNYDKGWKLLGARAHSPPQARRALRSPYELVSRAYHPCARVQGRMPQRAERNPQTVAFLEMLGLPYDLDPAAGPRQAPAPVAGECIVFDVS